MVSTSSKYFKYFVADEDDASKIICQLCPSKTALKKDATNATSGLRKHLQNVHKHEHQEVIFLKSNFL